MLLNITGRFPLQVTNIRTDTDTEIGIDGTQMPTAEIKVGEHKTPCIIRNESFGQVGALNIDQVHQTSITVFECLWQTELTKQGFVVVHIATKPVHISVFIHADHLESFFSACTMSALKYTPRIRLV
jgi:hypothetical protein